MLMLQRMMNHPRRDPNMKVKTVLKPRSTLIRRHHAHAAEDDEPSKKRSKYESEDSSSEDEYVLISALIGNITHGSMIGL